MTPKTKSVIIFDGTCNLCNGVVSWLLQVSPQDVFEFVPFQSNFGQELLERYGFPTEDLETVILIENDTPITHSDGFIKIVSKIPKYKYIAALMAFVPKILRDYIYSMAARNRVSWFGQSSSCVIKPSPTQISE